ncbi:MAG: glycosyltransferase family 39 protein [Candidatus Pelethousia sp.]|nr:glycosyltransferase family 39 protein [Candidatus Pelethousia sp.]
MKIQNAIMAILAALLLAAFGLWAIGASYYGLSMLAAGLCCALFTLAVLFFIPAFGGSLFASDANPDSLLGKRSLRWPHRHPWLQIALAVLLLRLFLYALAYGVDLRVNGYGGGLLDGLARLWLRTDSPSYLGIAQNWYVTEGDPRFHIVFFPLYPIFIRAFSYLTGGHLFAAALVVSNLCAVGGSILLYELAALDFPRREALYVTLLAALLPGAMFLGAPMTESLFLLLSLACAYATRRKAYVWAGLLGGLAAFARSVGVLLVALMAFEMFTELFREKDWRARRILGYLGCLLLVLMGTAGYLAINYFVTGDPFTFLTYQREHWNQGLGLFWNTIAYQTDYLLTALAGGELRMVLGLFLPNLACIFGALAIMLPAVRKTRPSYTAYFLVYFAVTIGCSWLLSAPRYLAVCFPLAFGLQALLGNAPKWLRFLVPLLLFAGLCAYAILYILGYPVY